MTERRAIMAMHLPELIGWRAGLTLTNRRPSGPELVAFKDRCRQLRVSVQEVEAQAQQWMKEFVR